MWSRVRELADRLTPEETSSLEELDHGPMRPGIPLHHAERLIGLGLAELSFGQLVLTIAGRQLLAEARHRALSLAKRELRRRHGAGAHRIEFRHARA